MSEVTYTTDRQGIHQMLNSDQMRLAMEVIAEEIKMRAEVMAPIYAGVGKDAWKDPHPGRYKASFKVKSQLHGGATNDRAVAVVYNDAPEAFWVEFAHWGAEPEHIMSRAAFTMIRGYTR